MRTLITIKVIGYLLVLQSCAPVFSELQSARTVGQNHVEVTPSYTSTSVTSEGETAGIQNHLGIQVAYGITDFLDFRARYENIWAKGGGLFEGSISVIGFGPKVSIVENRVAFSLALGRALGEGSSETWQLHPTLLLTQPIIEDKIEATLSPKYLITFCEGCDNLFAFNLGLSLSSDLEKWAIRPEYGILLPPGGGGFYSQFSLGISTTFGN